LWSLWSAFKVFIVSDERDIPRRSDRVSQISNELGRLFNQQTEFFRRGTRAEHTPTELAEYEKRRGRIRGLFAELDELKKAA
jgi:hypothetical protein